MDRDERRSMSIALTQAAVQMAHKSGHRFPHRVRVSDHIKHDVECHAARPRVVYVGSHAVTSTRILHLMERILEDARELRLQLHKLPYDPVSQTQRLIQESLRPNGDGKELKGCPKLTCLLCGDVATSRVMGLSKRFEACTGCASQVKAALGSKTVRVITLYKF